MTFGEAWGWGASEEVSKEQLKLFWDRGGNFIDTANRYTDGQSEEILGRLLEGRREQTVLATKFTFNTREGDPNAGGNARKNMVQAVEASLRRLRTEYIDLYWVHAWDRITPIDEVVRALDDLVRAGKVLYVGASDYPAWKVAEANTLADLRGWSPFVGLQILYNLASRDAERDLIPMARDLGLGVTPWSPLARGILTGKYSRSDLEEAGKPREGIPNSRRAMALQELDERKLSVAEATVEVAEQLGRSPSQVAIRWLLQRPGVASPILGARTAGQLEDNLGSLDFELTDEQMARLNESSDIKLGFPHDFLNHPRAREMLHGGAEVLLSL
jgi:aryl-alcohol dehydrogenase-like predicted oxidoreductase